MKRRLPSDSDSDSEVQRFSARRRRTYSDDNPVSSRLSSPVRSRLSSPVRSPLPSLSSPWRTRSSQPTSISSPSRPVQDPLPAPNRHMATAYRRSVTSSPSRPLPRVATSQQELEAYSDLLRRIASGHVVNRYQSSTAQQADTPTMNRVMDQQTCRYCKGRLEQPHIATGEAFLALLPCGHFFHKYCADNWFQFTTRCLECLVDSNGDYRTIEV